MRMNLYERWKEWTASLPRTDVVRAIFGILVVFGALFILFGLQGCSTVPTGPSMELAISQRTDGFIRLNQNVWQSSTCNPRHTAFIQYEHHSEILKETNENVYDGVLVGYKVQFGKFRHARRNDRN